MADKNITLKDGNDNLFPRTKAELVDGLQQGWGGIQGQITNQVDLQNALDEHVLINQGQLNANKFLVINAEGKVTPTTIYTWSGGSF